MQSLYHSSGINPKINLSHFVGFALCSLLAWPLFTPALYGNSGYYNEASATMLIDPPDAPDSLFATTLGQARIKLTWKDNSNNETGFKIERKIGAAGSYVQIAAPGPNVKTFTNTGLTANTEYFYRVRAHNASGNSAYSNEANATTLPPIPKAPGSLVATPISQNQIDLAWADSSNDENGFKIERKKGAAGTYAQIATVGPNVTTYSNTGLGANATFFYRVRAYNSGGNSAYANEASAATPPFPPKTPGNLTVTTVSKSQLNLAWTDSANNEDGFKIERKTGAAGTYAEIATVGANVTSYSNTGLNANTQYFYRVRAYNLGGHSSYSNEANAKTLPLPPAKPTNLAATTVNNTQINLSWTDGATNETGFKIERKTGADTYAEIATVGANVTNYSDSGLSGNTEYFYRVRASNTGGNSAYSNEANATTLLNPPAAPSNLTATTVSQTQIDLGWTDNADNEVGFKIERKTGAAGTYAEIAIVGANVTSYSDNGLNANTPYFYRVRAHNTGGHSAYSDEADATTLPNAPSTPDSLKTTVVSKNQIDLTWADSSDNEDGFKIERKTGAAGTYAEIATVGANVTSYSNTGLNANTQYFYRMRSHNTGGHSAYSNEAKAKTLPLPPAKPTNLAATTVNNTQINLTWTDGSTNETGFKIERKTGAAGTYTEIAAVGANVTSYSNTGLAANTEYFYRVRASNLGGTSVYSNEANATALPNAPSAPGNLTATTVSQTQIDLTWADSVDNEIGFKIERKTGVAGTYTEIATVGANVTAYSDTSLSPITEYFYQIRAHNASGHSDYSNEASATTLPNPPAVPSGLNLMVMSQRRINLAWTDNADNEDGFKIERKTGEDGTYAEIATVGTNVTAYADSNLSANIEYFYRMRAHNAGGHSGYTTEESATTLPIAPSAPMNLTATAVSQTQINLGWADSSNNEIGFQIERKTGAAGTYAQIATAGMNVTSYEDTTGLSPDTEYFYRVRTNNTGGHSSYSNEASATTLPNAPAAPGNLTATAVTNTQIDLAWADNSNNDDGFKIERKTGVAGTYAQIATTGANITSYADTMLTASTEYFYRVRANNTGGNSGYSNEASATTLLNPPAAPGNLTATAISNTQINLAWADSANNEDGFKIERKTGAAGAYAEIATVGANVTTYSNTGLTTSTEYYYRVRGYNTGGNSAYSNEVNTITLSNSNLALNKPTTASSTDSTSAASRAADGSGTTFWRSGFINASNAIQWLQVELSPTTALMLSRAVVTWYQTYFAKEYEFQISNDGANWTTVYTNNAGALGTQDFTFTATPARFVRLYLKKHEKSNYRVAEIEVYSGSAPPATPNGLILTTISQTQINLAWTDNADNEDGFKIERKTGENGTYAEVATVGANVTNYSNSGLSANTEYFYRVRSHNASGHSAYSNEASATTLPNPPAVPGNLSAITVSQTRINLAWADSANDETGFKIERKTGAAGTYAQIATAGANITSYADTALTASTEYFYRVCANNTGGNSGYSNEASATTLSYPLTGPGNLTATAISNTQINLAWSDSSDNEDGFKIERKTGAAGTYAEIATVGANVTAYSNTGLTTSTEYFYRVRAHNAGGNSAYSNEANTITLSNSNLALNKPTTASSTDSTSAASRAVDGSATTFWRSGFVNASNAIQWLQVELGPTTALTVGRAVVTWYQNYFAKEYEFQVSNDSTNWTTVYTNNAGALGTQDFTFTPTTARFVRLYLKKNEKSNYRVAEFEVYIGPAAKGAETESRALIIPSTITLEQNYPNPFNPSTTISYALPEGVYVTLKILNIAGQEVATLVNGYRERGIHRVTFNGVKLPSGVYMAILQAGAIKQVRRIAFAK